MSQKTLVLEIIFFDALFQTIFFTLEICNLFWIFVPMLTYFEAKRIFILVSVPFGILEIKKLNIKKLLQSSDNKY